MSPEDELRTKYEGAFLEFNDGEVRVFCRSPIDMARTLLQLAADEPDESVVVYGAHTADIEAEDPEKDALLMKVLEDPTVQLAMAMLGGEVIDVWQSDPS